jgi:hypothetical protein
MSRDNIKSERAVVFLHVPRTGGTTLHRIIERQYPPEQLYSVGLVAGESSHKLAQLSPARRAQIRMLRGHMGFGVHGHLPGPTTYVTLLRDPVERVVSYYYFILRTPTHYLFDCITSADHDLRTFVENETHIMIDNAQTRIVSGVWVGPQFGACTRDMLETAKSNLRDRFAVVGLTERFDETLLLLKKELGWQHHSYTRHNVTARRPEKRELSEAALDSILRANQLDVALYQYAKGLFEEQVRRRGPAFTRELNRYRRVNRWVGLLLWGYWQYRKVSLRAFVQRWINSSVC